MRPPTGLSPDGDLNMFNVVGVAASPAAGGNRVLVVLNDTIHSARDATKTLTYRVQSFQANDLGVPTVMERWCSFGAGPRAYPDDRVRCGGWSRCRGWTSASHASAPTAT
jgi:L-asparaginase/Glu-tRNA(Gln) amidotransferase subunit D